MRILLNLLVGMIFINIYPFTTHQSKAQQTRAKPVAINTLPKKIQALYRNREGREVSIDCSLIFNVEEVQAHPAPGVKGNIILFIAESERKKLSDYLGVALSKIPVETEIKRTIAELIIGSECPTIKVQLPTVKTTFFKGALSFEKQDVIIDHNNSKDNLGQLFCSWSHQYNTGFGHAYRLVRPINEKIMKIQKTKFH